MRPRRDLEQTVVRSGFNRFKISRRDAAVNFQSGVNVHVSHSLGLRWSITAKWYVSAQSRADATSCVAMAVFGENKMDIYRISAKYDCDMRVVSSSAAYESHVSFSVFTFVCCQDGLLNFSLMFPPWSDQKAGSLLKVNSSHDSSET